ncbi:unnamed protein product [Gongylonema pulchrum]|uniref:Uncharacterized protein n=1 Tax=Gongylonema pulchrum TaxID=637853 RepID=A0A183CVH8_9BILA|nr:unnamed protein product [Gongylonema pulchrum]
MNERANFEVERARLEKAISVQQEQIVQASRALSFCHSTQEFRGSREEVQKFRTPNSAVFRGSNITSKDNLEIES